MSSLITGPKTALASLQYLIGIYYWHCIYCHEIFVLFFINIQLLKKIIWLEYKFHIQSMVDFLFLCCTSNTENCACHLVDPQWKQKKKRKKSWMNKWLNTGINKILQRDVQKWQRITSPDWQFCLGPELNTTLITFIDIF